MSVVFIHYEVPREAVQQVVPFELDTHEGRAYASVVAFTQEKLRVAFGGWPGALGAALVANHAFLNVRTYVRERGEPGIFFLAEWVPKRLALWVAPALYGLPYRLGRLRYEHDVAGGLVRGEVTAAGGRLRYRAELNPATRFAPCAARSADGFLLERYSAFTQRGRVRRRFRVRHEPWPQARTDIVVEDDSLLRRQWPWWEQAQLIGSNFSPGVSEVLIGRAERLTNRSGLRTLTRRWT